MKNWDSDKMTVRIPASVRKEIERRAKASNKPITAVVRDLLVAAIAQSSAPSPQSQSPPVPKGYKFAPDPVPET
jgi:hypothetical protein